MKIKVITNCYGYALSTVTNGGQYFSRVYNGYEVEEAKELFEKYVTDELTSEILKGFNVDKLLTDKVLSIFN